MNTVETQTRRSLVYVAVAGAIGWGGTYAVDELSSFSLAQDIYLVVAGWAVLVVAGAVWMRRTTAIGRAKAWRIWLVASLVALGVNAVVNTPELVPDPDLFVFLQDYAYYHPWFAVYAVGYVATARYEPKSRLVGDTERSLYTWSGILSFAFLVLLFVVSIPDEYVILVGGFLNVLPPLVAVYVRRRNGESAPATRERTAAASEHDD